MLMMGKPFSFLSFSSCCFLLISASFSFLCCIRRNTSEDTAKHSSEEGEEEEEEEEGGGRDVDTGARRGRGRESMVVEDMTKEDVRGRGARQEE